jgi:hypothetical protein
MLAVVLAGIGLGGVVSGAMHSRLARSNLLPGLTTLFNTSGAALGPLLASFVLLGPPAPRD